jgi:hypothetical protein
LRYFVAVAEMENVSRAALSNVPAAADSNSKDAVVAKRVSIAIDYTKEKCEKWGEVSTVDIQEEQARGTFSFRIRAHHL